jgi:hypothetical protein
MRKVFSNSEACHVFASRTQDEGRSASIFFNRHTIYSYGYHFPIATFAKDGKTVYFTTRGYSNSTAKHINYAWQALNHFSFIRCANPEEARNERHEENFKSFNNEAKQSALKLANARKPENYLRDIEYQKELFVKYCEHFNIKVTKKLQKSFPYLFIETKEDGSEATKSERLAKAREAKRAELRRKEEAIKAKAKHEEDIEKFREFKIQRLYTRFDVDYLRLNTEAKTVETSQGVSIELDEAKRLFKLVKIAVQNGGCVNCGVTVSNLYEVTSIDSEFLIVGCHKIPMSEVNEIGARLDA